MNKRKTFRVGFSCLFMVFSFVSVNSNYMYAGKNISVQKNDTVYAVADKEPQFPGGETARNEFMKQNVHYPEEAQRNHQGGKVIVQFVINNSGKVQQAKVVKSVTPSLDKEALRVINSFPPWIPAELNGEKVSVYKVLPVTFKLTDPSSPVENPKIIAIDNILMPVNFDLNILNPTEIDTGNVIRPTTSEIKNQLIKKYGIVAENGIIEIYSNRFKKLKYKVQNESWDTIAKINPNDKNAIYSLEDVDIIPKFVGGNMNLINFISNNLKYPDECKVKGIQGSTFIQFVVDKTGKVKDAVVKNKINRLLEAEAIRVVNILPNWIPGEKHGEKVNVRLTVPVKFGIKGAIYPMENDSSTDTNSPPDRQLIVLDGTILPYGFDINWLNSSDIQSYKLLVPKNAAEEREFKLRYGPFSSRGVFVAFSKRFYSDNKIDSFGNRIYQVIEQMPVFPGGEIALMEFVAKNLKYPEASKAKHIQGIAVVRFIVNSEGKIEKSEVVRSLDPECDKEALRIVSLFPTWTPGKQNGVNVSVFYTLPIRFHF